MKDRRTLVGAAVAAVLCVIGTGIAAAQPAPIERTPAAKSPGGSSRDAKPPPGTQDLGPPIGVLLARGVDRVRIATAPGARLQVQTEESDRAARGHLVFPAGRYELAMTPERARLERDGRLVREFARQPFRLASVGGGATVVSRRVGGKWQDLSYEGWIELLYRKVRGSGGWWVVNRLPLERYLLGVIPSEMPTSFHLEALRAQAVAARTYALFQIVTRPPNARVHVGDGVASQVYRGLVDDDRARRAVESTRGWVLFYDGRLFESYFHSTCGGATQSARAAFGSPDLPVLTGVRDRAGDRRPDNCAQSSRYRWQARIPVSALRHVLEPLLTAHRIQLGAVEAVEPVDVGPGGHASYVRIVHSGGSFEVDAQRLRTELNGWRRRAPEPYDELSSPAFTCQVSGETLEFEGRGFGHGVGLCQYGAQGLAESGVDTVRILKFYYSGARVVELW